MQTNAKEQQDWLYRTNHGGWKYALAFSAFLILGLVVLSYAQVSDQYSYQSVEVPFPNRGTMITGMTDRGKLAGVYYDVNEMQRSWTFMPPRTFKKLTYKTKRIEVIDIAGSGRVVGYYMERNAWHAFTMHSGHFKELRIPNMTVGTCAINNDASSIVCNAWITSTGPEDYDPRNFIAFFTGAGTFVGTLETPYPWVGITVTGVNNRLDVVGWIEDGCPDGGHWCSWKMHGPLGPNPWTFERLFEPGRHIRVQGINDNGLMAVTAIDYPREGEDVSAFASDGISHTELFPPDAGQNPQYDDGLGPFRENWVTSVNNQGQFAGYYYDHEWNLKGFVATPSANVAQR
jgi:hypothetical protein